MSSSLLPALLLQGSATADKVESLRTAMAKSRKEAVPREPIDVKKELTEALAEKPANRPKNATSKPDTK
jgi:hypothetical protein